MFGKSSFYYFSREISQVDVAVTLSTLLGLSFPKGNVGKLIKGLIYHLTKAEQTSAYQRNSEQLMNKFLKIADEVSLFGMLSFYTRLKN